MSPKLLISPQLTKVLAPQLLPAYKTYFKLPGLIALLGTLSVTNNSVLLLPAFEVKLNHTSSSLSALQVPLPKSSTLCELLKVVEEIF